MKIKLINLTLIALVIALSSCTKDNSDSANLKLVVKSSLYLPVAKKAAGVAVVKLSDVYVNISKIEFKYNETEFEDESHSHDDSIVSEQELVGPFALTLMKDSVLLSNDLAAINLPSAAYDKVEFKLDKNTTVPSDNPLYNRSIYVTGSVNGLPFKFWHNSLQKVEIEFPDTSSVQIGNESFNLFIDFHLNRVIDALVASGIGSATDGNNNGIIEIGPDDTDGNQAIANLVFSYVKHSCDLDDDNSNENDDSNNDNNEDRQNDDDSHSDDSK